MRSIRKTATAVSAALVVAGLLAACSSSPDDPSAGVLPDPDIQPLSVRLPTLARSIELDVLLAALTISALIPMVLFLVFQRTQRRSRRRAEGLSSAAGNLQPRGGSAEEAGQQPLLLTAGGVAGTPQIGTGSAGLAVRGRHRGRGDHVPAHSRVVAGVMRYTLGEFTVRDSMGTAIGDAGDRHCRHRQRAGQRRLL